LEKAIKGIEHDRECTPHGMTPTEHFQGRPALANGSGPRPAR
jgi:hypothetical protein